MTPDTPRRTDPADQLVHDRAIYRDGLRDGFNLFGSDELDARVDARFPLPPQSVTVTLVTSDGDEVTVEYHGDREGLAHWKWRNLFFATPFSGEVMMTSHNLRAAADAIERYHAQPGAPPE